jgi:FixJ family two-component response regulator
MVSKQSFVVAIVDDDKRILRSLKSLLESVGYCPLLFTSAEEFLENNAVHKVDCLISDIGMSGMNGIELRDLALCARPELPIFLLTGRAELLPKDEAAARRGNLFLKPLNGLELVRALNSVLTLPAEE